MVMQLDNFFMPGSVAVIGASRNSAKIGHVILKNIVDGGYRGRVFPVNPEANEILGYRCYKSVSSVNEEINLAVISVPAEFVIRVVDECAKKKIKDLVKLGIVNLKLN
mgnify:FL=1